MAEKLKRIFKKKDKRKAEVDDRSSDEEELSDNETNTLSYRKKKKRLPSAGSDEASDDTFDDEIQSGHGEHFRQMDQLFRDPFMTGGLMALPETSRTDRRRQQQQAQNMQVAERNLFMDPFAHFGSMFSGMRSMMSDMHRAFEQTSRDPNAHVYQQSSFMSYSNTGNGAPRVYQASSSSRQAPGGVKETRKTVRDSNTGLERIAVGHHVNERAHVIERSRNNKTGEQNENVEYINLDEEEVQPFEQEYEDRWRNTSTMRGIDQRRRVERSRHAPAPVGDAPHPHRARHAALPEPDRRPRKSSNKRE